LADVNAIDFEEAFPQEHQTTLADGGQHLPAGKRSGQLGESQTRASGGLRTGGANDQLFILKVERRDLPGQLHHLRLVEETGALGKYARTQLNDDFAIHFWCSAGKTKTCSAGTSSLFGSLDSLELV